ncbi:undecaprenyl-phosphate galactose phosphotransferase WbaP [Desulforamulus aeronauticus]|uniref:Undecaprenyl-phosphate galactose phosphotransferase n=1 Tax=Desulforamulus aeronauticus DSM 10349 TaxID=1121421 RepID=A0A1M6T4B0_9FIRM|nr:undecaprenyl-phosphate galactose phosphotransferase WbaP [Desulforamulus aeronauticus]SHK51750.1 undecaprenyl-phosphate galactose phosphotransferase [Desulforamulus aeronauticus DSM 10349]
MFGGPAVKHSETVPLQYQPDMSNAMASTRSILAIPLLIVLDGLAIGISLLMAYVIRIYALPELFPGYFKPELLADTIQNIWWLPLVLISCMAYEDLYQKRIPFWKEVEKTLKACSLALIFSISLLYLAKMTGEISRTLIMITWFFSIVFIPSFRYYGKLLLIKLNIWNKSVFIFGAGATGELILKALAREQTMGYEIVGFLDDNKKLSQITHPLNGRVIPVLGAFEEAERIISSYKVSEVIVAAPGMPAKQLVELTNRLQPMVSNVMLVPDLFGLSMNGIEVEYFFDEQALLLNVRNQLKSTLNRSVKRAFDLVVGLLLLLLCTPFLLLMAMAIRFDSNGPAFFAQERLGQDGTTFVCYKFRTMFLNGDRLLKRYLSSNELAKEEWETYNKLREHDPRVTRVGSILRRFSIDELPQLLNVIIGDMSLVGPRPYLPRERKQMATWAHDIHVAKPGITGLWQVSGRNEIEFEGRLKLDTWYVRNWSMWLDIVLLLKTFKVVLKREGAY